MSSVMVCYPDTSETLYHSTCHNTSEGLNLYHIHPEDTKSHRLRLPVTKLHKVIISSAHSQKCITRKLSKEAIWKFDKGTLLL